MGITVGEIGATLASMSSDQRRLPISCLEVYINEKSFVALVDTGSSASFISGNVAKLLNVKSLSCNTLITLASTHSKNTVRQYCLLDISIHDKILHSVEPL